MESQPTKTWLGSSINDLCNGISPWSFAVSALSPSRYHTVLYELPVKLQQPPKPHYNLQKHLWEADYVRMPFSDQNLFPVKENGSDVIKKRWEVIKDALSVPITSVEDFEMALNKYNLNMPKLDMLHYFFKEIMEQDVKQEFFTCLLPKIIRLALRMPELVPCGLPLLQQNRNRSVSLSQLQISSILANAFLCTFPWKKQVAAYYPGVNFVTLFSSFERQSRRQCLCEKLKCILNYFQRITNEEPKGVVTFERKMVPKNVMPKWQTIDKSIDGTRLHVSSVGTIEEARGFLQVDFANKNIGGGVLRYGCVQEEIRFVICPELIASRLFVEQLNRGEAVVITGIERFSNYLGYGDTFVFSGDHRDTTPHDHFGRRRTSICVIDAIKFSRSRDQFQTEMVSRELNKAFVGFSSREKGNLAPVATGNWGCGAFNGNKELKALLQLMACCVAGRNMMYYTFGDDELLNSFYDIHTFLSNNRITISQLDRFLAQFCASSVDEKKLYPFIKQAYFDSKKQPSISKFFLKDTKVATTSPVKRDQEGAKKTIPDDEVVLIEETSSSSSDDVIPSSQPSPSRKFIKPINIKTKTSPVDFVDKLADTDIGRIFDMLDGNANQTKNEEKTAKTNAEPNKTEEETMDIDGPEASFKTNKKKITDYFQKTTK